MALLPKLNAEIEFSTNLPSSGREVKFRPFLVKEEKALLFAAESKDQKQMLNTLISVIEACYKNVKPRTLTTFDMEYLILQLRARSAGEVHAVQCVCKECEKKNDVEVNLDEIKIDASKKPGVAKLSSDYSLQMRWPLVQDLLNLTTADMKDPFKVIPFYIDTLKTNEEVIKFGDATKTEQQEFIDSLTREQFEAIEAEMKKVPILTHVVKFKCKNCSAQNELELKGLTDFFSS